MTVSPTQQDFERVVRAFVAEGSGLEKNRVIEGNKNAPSPNELYATVLLIDDGEIGTNQVINRDSGRAPGELNIDTQVIGSNVARFSVQFYRTGAVDACKCFRKYKSTPNGQIFLKKNNITLKLGSQVQRIDDIISDKFEERARIEIEVRYLDQTVQSFDSIGTVNFDACHNDGGDLTLNEEVQINDT